MRQAGAQRQSLRRGAWLRSPAWLCALCLLCIGLDGVAHARSHRRHRSGDGQAADPQDTSRLRQEGLAALQAARFGDANRLLSAAYATAPSPQGLYLLGQLALAEKRDLDAHDLMRRYLADPDLEHDSEGRSAQPATSGTAPPPDNPEVKEAERVLGLPRPPAATLNILGERGTRVYVDSRLVGVLPLSLPLLLSPSEHKIVLERGQQHIEDQVQIPAGRLGELRSDVSSRALLLSTLPGVLFVADLRELSPELRARLQQSVEKALLSRRLSPLASDVALTLLRSSARKLGDCLSELSCQVELAKQVEVDAILHVRSTVDKGALRLQVALIDTAVEQEAASDEVQLDSLAAEPAATGLLGLVRRVYEVGSARPRAELNITCQPSDAELAIDGRVLPACRYQRAAFAGERLIRAQKPGLTPFEQRLSLREGEKRTLDIQLFEPEPAPAALLPPPPPPPPLPRRQPRPVWRLALGGVALAGGLVTAGFGVAMLSIDGQCVAAPAVEGGVCERRYVTQGPGGITVGIGLGLAIAGGLLIGIPGPMK